MKKHTQNDAYKLFNKEESTLAKYKSYGSRNRQLNIPEKSLIDHYQLHNQRILIVGGGTGRLASNLLLFGNKVVSIDYSMEFTNAAKSLYSKDDFMNIEFYCMDGRNLESLYGSDFDTAICPMNTIDYAPTLEDREKMLLNIYKCLKKDGVFAFASRQIGAYTLSPKVNKKAKSFKNIFVNKIVKKVEYVNPITEVYMTSEEQTIKYLKNLFSIKNINIFCDSRGYIDYIMSKKRLLRRIWYPYLMYAFIK